MQHFQFFFDWSAHLERYILLNTTPQSDQWFQSYEQLKDSQNNRKQKKFFIPFSGYISQSMLPTSDWFRKIIPHLYIDLLCQDIGQTTAESEDLHGG